MPAISGNVGAVFNGGTITSGLTVNDGAAALYATLLHVAVTEGAVLDVDGGGEVTISQRDAGASPLAVTALNSTAILVCFADSSVEVNGGIIGTAVSAGDKLGFFKTPPVAKPTAVAVSAAGIHAALVTLGLIAA